MIILRQMGAKRHFSPLLYAAAIALLATGCKTYQEQNHVIQYWRQGNMTNAVLEANKMVSKNQNNKDTIIWELEQGAVLRGAGKYEDSNKAFDQAQNRIDKYAQEARVKLGNEAGALLSNQANLPYEGRSYDGIMLNTYKALNYLQLGDPDKARVELIRAYQRQQDAVEDNKKRIAKVQAESAKNTNSAAINKAQSDPKFQSQIQGVYTGLDNLKPYADYVNPFTVYLDGLFFMANAADGSDLERARKSLERVASFAPDNTYVSQDLAAVNDVINGKPLSPTTYVIFETGCAPMRDQIRIDIPILVAKLSYIGAAFPTLKLQGDYVPSLTVIANGVTTVTTNTVVKETTVAASGAGVTTNDTTVTVSTTTATNSAGTTVSSSSTVASNETAVAASGPVTAIATNDPAVTTNSSSTTTINSVTVTTNNLTATTSLVASMDSVVGLDFKNEMPVVITKTIASTVAKAVAAYAANQAASQQSDIAGLFMQLGTAIYQAAVNIADERTWTTLPKEFQVCRLPTPPDRKMELQVNANGQKIPVTIEDGTINIVYVRSITAAGPVLVTQFKLK